MSSDYDEREERPQGRSGRPPKKDGSRSGSHNRDSQGDRPRGGSRPSYDDRPGRHQSDRKPPQKRDGQRSSRPQQFNDNDGRPGGGRDGDKRSGDRSYGSRGGSQGQSRGYQGKRDDRDGNRSGGRSYGSSDGQRSDRDRGGYQGKRDDRDGNRSGGRSYGDRDGQRSDRDRGGYQGKRDDRDGNRSGGRSYGSRDGQRSDRDRGGYQGSRGGRDDNRSGGRAYGSRDRDDNRSGGRSYGSRDGQRSDRDRGGYQGGRGGSDDNRSGGRSYGSRDRDGNRSGGRYQGDRDNRGGDRRSSGGGFRDSKGNSFQRRDAVRRDDRRSEREDGSRRGDRSTQRPAIEAPEIPDEIQFSQLDRTVRQSLRTLSKDNAEDVGRHLIMAGALIELEPELAYKHAQVALARGGRVDVVREANALAAYATGRYTEALREFRTVRRLNGSSEHLPLMADCERGLGRPERAIDLARSDEANGLDKIGRAELEIVAAGARLDMGDAQAALVALRRIQPVNADIKARVDEAMVPVLRALGRDDEADTLEASLPVPEEDDGEIEFDVTVYDVAELPEPQEFDDVDDAGDDVDDVDDDNDEPSETRP